MTYAVDPQRVVEHDGGMWSADLDQFPPTGIFVRAQFSDRWVDADIAWLDHASLLDWLHSRGQCNRWAEATVLLILGHAQDGGEHPA